MSHANMKPIGQVYNDFDVYDFVYNFYNFLQFLQFCQML